LFHHQARALAPAAMGRPWSKATPARSRLARRYIANARLALAEPPMATRPKAYSIGQRTPVPGQLQRARYTACRAQALGVSLSRSRQIRREPNDNKHLQLQTSALSLIEPYRVLAKVTNRRAPVQALMSRKGFLAQWQTLTISRAGSDRGRFRGGARASSPALAVRQPTPTGCSAHSNAARVPYDATRPPVGHQRRT
jgi:hypothetical protein